MPGIKAGERIGGGTQTGRQSHRLMGGLGFETWNLKRRAADLLGFELGEDFLRDVEVCHRHRLAGRAQQGLQRPGPLGPRTQTFADGPGFDRVFPQHGGESALQNSLRAFAEALELFRHLLKEFQAGGALGEVAVDLLKFFLRLAKLLGEFADLVLQLLRLRVGASLEHLGFLHPGVYLGELGGGGGLLLANAFDLGGQGFVALGRGFLVHFVAGRIGAQPGHMALKLQKLKLGLRELLFVFRKLGFEHGELAVAVLENRVGTAEQGELHLFVLRAAIDLRFQLAQLHFELSKIGLRAGQTLGQAAAFDLGEVGGVLRLLFFRAQIEDRLLRLLHALVQADTRRFFLLQLGLLLLEMSAAGLGGGTKLDHVFLQGRELGGEDGVMIAVVG